MPTRPDGVKYAKNDEAMDIEEKEHRVKKLWRKLNEHFILVEGKNDVAALREVGIYTQALTAVGKPERTIRKAIALAGKLPIALLFDYDLEGDRKTWFYHEMFYNEDCNADLMLRKELKELFPIKTIEDLPHAYFDWSETAALHKKFTRELSNKPAPAKK